MCGGVANIIFWWCNAFVRWGLWLKVCLPLVAECGKHIRGGAVGSVRGAAGGGRGTGGSRPRQAPSRGHGVRGEERMSAADATPVRFKDHTTDELHVRLAPLGVSLRLARRLQA